MISFFKWKHLTASIPEAALCFQSTFYLLCHFSCFSVSSWEGRLAELELQPVFKMLLYHNSVQCLVLYFIYE